MGSTLPQQPAALHVKTLHSLLQVHGAFPHPTRYVPVTMSARVRTTRPIQGACIFISPTHTIETSACPGRTSGRCAFFR